jgi:hypothetical protein
MAGQVGQVMCSLPLARSVRTCCASAWIDPGSESRSVTVHVVRELLVYSTSSAMHCKTAGSAGMKN